MKYIFFIFFLILASCQNKIESPDKWFSKIDQQKIINQSVRYSAKLPPDATHETKFDSAFFEYYQKATDECDWRACAQIEKGKYFFLITRKARSIWPAREAIGGRLSVDGDNNLIDYEEVFRTWKMAEDSLNTRSFELFNLMVKGKDLTPYRSKYMGDRYIEFPDDRYEFNKKLRRWSDRVMDTVEVK